MATEHTDCPGSDPAKAAATAREALVMRAETPPENVRELQISVRRDEWAEYTGTAAQLQAEGLIPHGFEWPRAATAKSWEAGGFDYWLSRERPEGHRGPMRSWLELDNWCIRIRVTGRDWHWRTRRDLERKAEALRAEYHRLTAAGSREWDARFNRYWETVKDKRFQDFKALIPGLVPPKRGRKPRAISPVESQK